MYGGGMTEYEWVLRINGSVVNTFKNRRKEYASAKS